ncbi:hypothetical protein L873DRAFT_1838653 [Choiromyces venosus 120613-1]|uniref:EGF-like calcium-binding domain-containing protein n=1 Tax=Choiromyces venosus 120613-1 TaxID=1336337 RepID=A0A3N4JCD3_9PEZI|nr:hypothetical protein L873DRAFT_1838653 [Choiromyces venosus 120613-1]
MKSILAVVLTLLNFFLFASAAGGRTDYPPSCEQCDPLPPNNHCDITTSCIRTEPTGQYHCACRAGYKAAGSDTDGSLQYRTNFGGQEYRVFVRPGVVCDTLCDEYWLGPQSCAEIPVRPECS